MRIQGKVKDTLKGRRRSLSLKRSSSLRMTPKYTLVILKIWIKEGVSVPFIVRSQFTMAMAMTMTRETIQILARKYLKSPQISLMGPGQ